MVHMYIAGLDPADRSLVERMFSDRQIRVICKTFFLLHVFFIEI